MMISRLKAYGICLLAMLYHWIAGKIMYFLIDKDWELLAIVFPVPMAIVSIMMARDFFSLASEGLEFDDDKCSEIVCRIAGIYTVINSAILIVYYYYYYG